MENIIEIRNLNKKLKGFKLKDISFSLPKGYIMGLIGPNGAGKSTTISCMMDLYRPDAGEISLFGQQHSAAGKAIKQRIGFVFDENVFYEDLTLAKNKNIIAPFYENWDEDVFRMYVQSFKLPLSKKVKHLSKGVKMKFALAVALSHHADLLIMDEPTAGLDPIFRRELIDILLDFVQDENKSVFFSTHITTDLEQVADYITFINGGKIVFSKEKEDLFEKYAILKGPAEMYEEVKLYLTGTKRNELGFKGLIEDVSTLPVYLREKVSVERASLEDIMYCLTRGQ